MDHHDPEFLKRAAEARARIQETPANTVTALHRLRRSARVCGRSRSGFFVLCPDDLTLLAHGLSMYDAYYAWLAHDAGETHTWKPVPLIPRSGS